MDGGMFMHRVRQLNRFCSHCVVLQKKTHSLLTYRFPNFGGCKFCKYEQCRKVPQVVISEPDVGSPLTRLSLFVIFFRHNSSHSSRLVISVLCCSCSAFLDSGPICSNLIPSNADSSHKEHHVPHPHNSLPHVPRSSH